MKAAAASVDISPTEPVDLGAAGVGNSEWLGITEPIEANLLALTPDVGLPFLFVSVDLLYAGRAIRSAVEAAAHPLPADRIFLAATHNHRAPMTDDTKPLLGTPDPAYMASVEQRITEAVRMVLAPERAEAAELFMGQGRAAHSINRRLKKLFFLARRPRFNEILNAPNPSGATDETLATLSVRTPDGRLLGLIWNYACHPVGFPYLNTVAAHFPHVIRERIRADRSSGQAAVLYFQGFSGNTRPSASAVPHSLTRRLRRLISGPLFEDMTPGTYRQWSESLADAVAQVVDVEEPIEAERIDGWRANVPGTEFADPVEEDVTFHSVYVGDALCIAGVSGEVVAEYAPEIRKMAASTLTMCVGCIDHPMGYIPTRKILQEGGYEGGGYCAAFGLQSLNSEIEAHTLSGFRSVLER